MFVKRSDTGRENLPAHHESLKIEELDSEHLLAALSEFPFEKKDILISNMRFLFATPPQLKWALGIPPNEKISLRLFYYAMGYYSDTDDIVLMDYNARMHWELLSEIRKRNKIKLREQHRFSDYIEP